MPILSFNEDVVLRPVFTRGVRAQTCRRGRSADDARTVAAFFFLFFKNRAYRSRPHAGRKSELAVSMYSIGRIRCVQAPVTNSFVESVGRSESVDVIAIEIDDTYG